MSVSFEKVKLSKASYFVAITSLLASIYLAGANTAHAYTKFPHVKTKTQDITNIQTQFKTAKVDGLDIFYREAGSPEKQTIVLLHDIPSASHMFRNIIPQLARNFHVIAPDYPGSGNSTQADASVYDYSFETFSQTMAVFLEQLGETKYTLYLAGKGAPVGFRLAAEHPERIEGLIIQDGNAYDEGLHNYWTPIQSYWNDKSSQQAAKLKESLFSSRAIKNEYLYAAGEYAANISPDNWNSDLAFLNRPGNKDIQLELLYAYGNNLTLHSEWQDYFNTYQPATLVLWGKDDHIFRVEAAESYERDLNKVDVHILDTGYKVLEKEPQKVGKLVANFMVKNHRTKHLSNWNRKHHFDKVISARRF